MRRIKLLTDVASQTRYWAYSEVYAVPDEIPEELADELLGSGQAELVEGNAVEDGTGEQAIEPAAQTDDAVHEPAEEVVPAPKSKRR